MIIRGLALGTFASNCYIVGSEETKEAMIIDPGAEPEAVLTELHDAKLTAKLIVATHGHFDHIAAVAKVKEATGAEFAMHVDDARVAASHQGRMMSAFFGEEYDPAPPPDRLLRGGDVIEVGELRFTVLHTPGHSPGGISLYGHGVAFVGDTLFNFSVGRTDFPGSSWAQLLNSIHTKLLVLPDNTRVFPGHGAATDIGTERKWNPFLRE